MAANLVRQSNIAHTFVHDLESAFWVLLWVAFAFMPNTWSDVDRSSFLRETMSPRVYATSGGRSKLFFMQADHSMWDFHVDNNFPLTGLIKNLKRTLSIRHTPRPSPTLAPLWEDGPEAILAEADDDEFSNTAKEHSGLVDQMIRNHDMLMRCLNDHSVILSMIQRSLRSPGWPSNDAAVPQAVITCNEVLTSARTGSKRSRSVAEDNGVFLRHSAAKR